MAMTHGAFAALVFGCLSIPGAWSKIVTNQSPQGPGEAWLGINGGYAGNYNDSLGRLWYNSETPYSAYTWGGYIGAKPKAWFRANWIDGNETLGKYTCRNWPPSYDQDYDALLHHYSRESTWTNQTFRVNLQASDAPVSFYTVKYTFCETKDRGGKKWDIVINGKTVKEDYVGKWAHHHTDIYDFKCIPTSAGMIEVSLVAKDSNKPQARFSTLEFVKTTEGCGECEGRFCGKGLCTASSFYDRTLEGGWGARWTSLLPNQFETEEPESLLACACDEGVEGDSCEVGVCATVNCNEPFGGFCNETGVCTCINGYHGEHCKISPKLDQFGCYEDHMVSGRLTVSTVCLPELIAGPARHGNLFRGPSQMSTVSDKVRPDYVYFSWTADVPYGRPDVAPGSEGRVYVSKLKVPWKGAPVLEESFAFEGFVRAGGIDMTEDGILGTICAKYWQPWVDNKNSHLDKVAMVVAVCEVNSSTMEKHRLPWQIGKQYQETVTAPNTGIWGSYPTSAWWAQRSAGYGYLLYAPEQRMWTAWYGATVDHHTGYAMHTYHRDAPGISDEEYAAYKYPVPRDMVEPRQEADGPWRDYHRTGTGDHQKSAAWAYHPLLKDIGLYKHEYGPARMQQYGLAQEPIGMSPAGNFRYIGHKGGMDLKFPQDEGYDYGYGDDESDKALQANAIRPCGEDWILAFPSDKGNVCAQITRLGEINIWKVIDEAVAKMPCGSSGGNCGDGAPGRMLRLAPLGTSEQHPTCGPEARFLFGYERPDRTRWLVELDGDCNEVTEKLDVTQHTHWPLYQDWTTTTDGAVVWVTSWHPDVTGSHGPPGTPNGVWPYSPKPRLSEEAPEAGEYLYGLTPQAINKAKVTVYYPNGELGSTTSGATAATTTTTTTTTAATTTAATASMSTARLVPTSTVDSEPARFETVENRASHMARTGLLIAALLAPSSIFAHQEVP